MWFYISLLRPFFTTYADDYESGEFCLKRQKPRGKCIIWVIYIGKLTQNNDNKSDFTTHLAHKIVDLLTVIATI